MHRRLMLKALAATGIGTAAFHRAVVAFQEKETDGLTVESIKQAEWITELDLADEEREAILRSVEQTRKGHEQLRKIDIDASVAPALHFLPMSRSAESVKLNRSFEPNSAAPLALPDNDEAIAFLPVHQLAGLIKSRKLTSTRLTKIYLDRLKKYGPMLRCVVTLTEDLALTQAAEADREIARGEYRGPLHGIPWGAKDLISVPGYPTTWGIPYLMDNQFDVTATVAHRLQEAGAVLVAKLSLGALAMGDKWFGGLTRNPWNPKVGSSGSSAGSASAVVAGLVGFTLGSETLGSILSPCRRCGATGLRPTFGRVSRHGCMPLSWSMDKIGPICRSVEDCALIFGAIHGSDGEDLTVRDHIFQWPLSQNLRGIRIGYAKSRRQSDEDREDLKILRELGCELVELELPSTIPFAALRTLTNTINVEGASVFDSMLRDRHTDGWNSWTNIFRSAQYISAVDYLRYQRVRTMLMKEFTKFMEPVDAIVNMNDIFHTNLTGHPSVVFPRTYRERDGIKRPVSVVITGHLNQDDQVLSIANAFQAKLDAHQQRPPLDDWLEKFDEGTLDEKPEKAKTENKASDGPKNRKPSKDG